LTHSEYRHTFLGLGKGLGVQSKLSAQFEALEHVTVHPSLTDLPVEFISPRDIHDNQLPILPNKLPIGFFEKNINYDCPLPWVQLKHIARIDDMIYLPVVCVSPTYLDFLYPTDQFKYNLVYLHQVDNGVAIGSNVTEALIHALSEAVERDGISRFIRETFIENKHINLIDMDSLPEKWRHIIRLVEEKSGYQCIITKAPTPVLIPIYMAFLISPNLITPIKGFGCSLNESYAIERAILEMIEQYDAYDFIVKEEDELTFLDIKEHPRWLKCFEFNLIEILHAKKYKKIKFSPIANDICHLDDYLQKLITRISAFFDIYTTTLYETNNVATVKVVLEQSSDLFMVMRGIIPPEISCIRSA
jgi:ribosomal protein S12 methylthiotransferase accessory factor